MVWRKSVEQMNLHPAHVRVMSRTTDILAEEGVPFKIYSGNRTFEEQEKLYAIGRTTGKKGAIVTKARGGQSMHNYGCATDQAPFNLLTDDNDDIWWPDPDKKEGKVWYMLEEALEQAVKEVDDEFIGDLEFEWGGRWRFRDVPHCQIRMTLGELRTGWYPWCHDVGWLVRAHTSFLFDNKEWMQRRVQYLLNMLSYDAGAVDGVVGNRTLGALQAFITDQKMESPADVNRDVVERLVRLHQTGMSLPRGTTPEDV